MGVVLDYSAVADIYREENSSPQLAKVPSNFYEGLRKLIEEKRREALELGEQEGGDVVIAELRRLLFFQKAIVQKRLEKIFFHAARGTRPENMTEEEERIFQALLSLREGFIREVNTGERVELSSPLQELEEEIEKEEKGEETKEGGQEVHKREEEQGEEREDERFMQVLITEYVEAYRGLDGNIYGPYKEGEKVKLPKEEGEWLVMAGMAKKVK